MPYLPDKIISDILSRLPVVSLCRFRCVSKPWRSLISHPDFIRTHLNRNANNRNERLVLSDGVRLHSGDIEWSHFGDGVYLTSPTELDLDLGVDCEEICGSCDGLLLIGFWMDDDECNHYSLVNPSTREFRKLSPSPFAFDPSKCYDDYGLGYDSQSDDYKVVSISRPFVSDDNVVSVYALRTNTWKKIESSPYDHWNLGHKSGVFVSGTLHWFAGTSTSIVIVALDLADEKFRTVPSLGCGGDNKLSAGDNQLTVLGGCLCVSGKWGKDNHADFWVMKEYGVGDSWTRFTVVYDSYRDSWKPLSSSRIGRVLFQVNNKKLVLFDLMHLQEEKSKELVVHGLPTHFEAETYVESLVSPNNAKNHNRLSYRYGQFKMACPSGRGRGTGTVAVDKGNGRGIVASGSVGRGRGGGIGSGFVGRGNGGGIGSGSVASDKRKAVDQPQQNHASKRLTKVGEGWFSSQQSSTAPSKFTPGARLTRKGKVVTTLSSQASFNPTK